MISQIKMIKLSQLTSLENNPRKITKQQFDKLKKSLEASPDYLFVRPLLVNHVDDKMTVYAGNQRLRAAKALKWKEIPCIVEFNLSPEEVKRRIILDNKTFGEFDFDILANTYDIEDLYSWGFDTYELEGMSENIDISEPPTDNDEKKNICPTCGHIIKG
jgi:ParB-like chromosome segregation protein Spo0J